jgi:hypothetical protein
MTLTSTRKAHMRENLAAVALQLLPSEVEAMLAQGDTVIKCPFSLNMLKDTYDHSCH